MLDLERLNKLPFFFIIGRPRSGTTLLRTLFDANKNTSIPLESRIIIKLYFKFRWVKNWNEKKLMKFYHTIFQQPKIDNWLVDKEQLKKDFLALGKDANIQSLIKLLYLNYISFFKKEEILIIGDKNPIYSFYFYYLKHLLKLFPEAKIIHLTRDYRDHYLSMKQVKFEKLNYLSMVCYRWKYSFNMVRKLTKHRPDKYYFIRYEDLVTNPEKEMTALCCFLKISYHESMLRFYEIKDEVLAVYPDKNVTTNRKSLFSPINTANIGAWKNQLTTSEIHFADSLVGNAGIEARYERVIKKNFLKYKFLALPNIIYNLILQCVKPIYDTIFLMVEVKK